MKLNTEASKGPHYGMTLISKVAWAVQALATPEVAYFLLSPPTSTPEVEIVKKLIVGGLHVALAIGHLGFDREHKRAVEKKWKENESHKNKPAGNSPFMVQPDYVSQDDIENGRADAGGITPHGRGPINLF